MRPSAEISIIHPRTWNILISPWSRSGIGLARLPLQVFRKYKCTCSREDFFFFPPCFSSPLPPHPSLVISRLTADSFFNFRSRVTDYWTRPGVVDNHVYSHLSWIRFLVAARKFIVEFISRITKSNVSESAIITNLTCYHLVTALPWTWGRLDENVTSRAPTFFPDPPFLWFHFFVTRLLIRYPWKVYRRNAFSSRTTLFHRGGAQLYHFD